MPRSRIFCRFTSFKYKISSTAPMLCTINVTSNMPRYPLSSPFRLCISDKKHPASNSSQKSTTSPLSS